MKVQCRICNSMVEDVSGICPVCGAGLGEKEQEHSGEPITEKLLGGQAAGAGQGQPYAPNMNGSYGQTPYNYQSPVQLSEGNTKKKKLFSILAILLAVLAILLVCFPIPSILCSIAAIVLGILALVKKQIKAPAILGIVFGSIFLIIGIIYLFMNLLIQSVVHTNINGIMKQCWDAYYEEPQSVDETGIYIDYPDGTSVYYAFRIEEGYWETSVDFGGEAIIYNGTYETCNYMTGDERIRDSIQNEILAAMREGYEIKDITCVVLSEPKKPELSGNTLIFTDDVDYEEKILVFVFPENYQMGDSFYLIQTKRGGEEYDLIPIDGQIPLEPLESMPEENNRNNR